MIEAGRVGRPHGLDGSFYVTRPEAGWIGDTVEIGGVQRRVVRRAGTDAKLILRVEGIDAREAAEALRGEPLLVERSDEMLDEDEYWVEDLVGLTVADGERVVGTVERVRSLPSCEVLEVGELLIPLVNDAVRGIDLAAGRIDVDLEFLGAG